MEVFGQKYRPALLPRLTVTWLFLYSSSTRGFSSCDESSEVIFLSFSLDCTLRQACLHPAEGSKPHFPSIVLSAHVQSLSYNLFKHKHCFCSLRLCSFLPMQNLTLLIQDMFDINVILLSIIMISVCKQVSQSQKELILNFSMWFDTSELLHWLSLGDSLCVCCDNAWWDISWSY